MKTFCWQDKMYFKNQTNIKPNDTTKYYCFQSKCSIILLYLSNIKLSCTFCFRSSDSSALPCLTNSFSWVNIWRVSLLDLYFIFYMHTICELNSNFPETAIFLSPIPSQRTIFQTSAWMLKLNFYAFMQCGILSHKYVNVIGF